MQKKPAQRRTLQPDRPKPASVRFLRLLAALCPVGELVQNGDQLRAGPGDGIFHPHRHLQIFPAAHQPVLLHLPQGLGQDGIGNMVQPAGQAPLFVMGTASASCLWFFGMTALLSFFREKISGTVLLWINRACGCVLMFYGAKLLWSFVQLLRG